MVASFSLSGFGHLLQRVTNATEQVDAAARARSPLTRREFINAQPIAQETAQKPGIHPANHALDAFHGARHLPSDV